MPENNNKNASGSKIPASTEGLSRKGSVSPEDLRKYNFLPTDNDASTNDANSVVGKDVGTSSDFVNNVPRSNPIPAPVDDTNVDHLQASKSNDADMKNLAGVGAGVAASSATRDKNQSADSSQTATANNGENETDKPWENTFDSDTDESGHVSRAVSKSKQRGNHTLVAVLVIILIALMFIPVTMYFVRGDGNNSNLDNGQTEQSVEKQDKDTTKKSSAKKKPATKKKTTTKKKSSSSKKKSNSNSGSGVVNEETTGSDATSSSTGETNSNEATGSASNQTSQATGSQSTSAGSSTTGSSSTGQQSSSSNSGSTGASYYTVKQGEGWYRAAVNSGMTTAQLRSLNPGVSTLSPGTQLRTK